MSPLLLLADCIQARRTDTCTSKPQILLCTSLKSELTAVLVSANNRSSW
jgi:hypothetical protein